MGFQIKTRDGHKPSKLQEYGQYSDNLIQAKSQDGGERMMKKGDLFLSYNVRHDHSIQN